MFGTRTRTRTVQDTGPSRTHVWSPAQLFAVVLGVAAIVLGAFALTRTGLNISHLTRPHDHVLSFEHTPLLALCEIGFGALMVIAGLRPIAGRGLMTLVGAATLGLGVVIVADFWGHRMQDWFGVHDRGGWVIVGIGAAVLVVSFVAPVFGFGGTRRIVRERVPREREPADDGS